MCKHGRISIPLYCMPIGWHKFWSSKGGSPSTDEFSPDEHDDILESSNTEK